MTYSSALFATCPRRWPDLAAAQRCKIDRLLDAARASVPAPSFWKSAPGWGELCHARGARGAHVRSITLSAEPAALGEATGGCRGPVDRVHIDLCDYRDVEGTTTPCYRWRWSKRLATDSGRRTSGAGPIGDATVACHDSGHHHAARSNAGHPQHLHLDPEVHLPRRHDSVDRGDHRHHREPAPGYAP